MRQPGSWVTSVRVGFARACVVLVVVMLVPAVWAAAVTLWLWWGGNPWSWVAPFLWAGLGTFALSRPVCRIVRSLVARWTGTAIPAGYREPGPVIQLSTGYWWNGHSYERTARDAHRDQRWRTRWHDPATWRDLRFTAIAPLTAGVLAAVPPAGLAVAVLGFGGPAFGGLAFGGLAFGQGGSAAVLVGVLGLVVAVAAAPHAWRPLEPVAARFLRPSPAMALADRVDELTAQRADVTVAQAAEIRRIERDLHDGAQARLVALGLSLATAEKLMDAHPDRAKALLREARAGAATSLTELRDLVRGISPPVLTERGLVDALRALALDSPLDTSVHADLRTRLEPPIEAAVYFAVAELLTNAVKHADADRARISLTRHDAGLVVEVEDDGRGGARVRAGGGLAGLRRRLAVFDGTCGITSPPGGPTRVTMVVPCASW
ncbi:sensor histidine kinase [Saccharothrix australiensis]|uniref:histidine kinase n=1 Tax=Saccharothrix australiensis TaxID=2072 RepID=A0A495W102_9PSEU|nr:histidine kinase [Saccharothrix australiensis]RKT55352.1 signal transduction histidine kinase [Saccharothrix australiensis]